jgi:hypothetical protein
MRFTKPNVKHEWREAERYKIFREMGFDAWVKLCHNGKPVRFSEIESQTGNVDLNFDGLEKEKKDRFYEAFDNGSIEMPIVARFSNNKFDLVAGNTRIAGLVMHKIDPYVWLIDITKPEQSMNHEMDEAQFSPPPHETETYNKIMGKKHTTEEEGISSEDKEKMKDIHPNGILDWEKNDSVKTEPKEMTGAASAGAYSAPLFSTTKKKIQEALDASASGQFDVPAFGTSTKGRKDPLKIDGVKSIGKTRAVKDKKFPKWGGPDSVFIKIKDKCKKFPYCNQGDINAIEVLREDEELQEAIKKAAEMYNLPFADVERVVINEINKIFI